MIMAVYLKIFTSLHIHFDDQVALICAEQHLSEEYLFYINLINVV